MRKTVDKLMHMISFLLGIMLFIAVRHRKRLVLRPHAEIRECETFSVNNVLEGLLW